MQYKMNPKIAKRFYNDLLLLYDYIQKKRYIFSKTSLELWNYLTQGLTVENIIAKMISKYPDAPPELIANDTNNFVETLIINGILLIENSQQDKFFAQVKTGSSGDRQDIMKSDLIDRRYMVKASLALTYRCNFRCRHCYVPTHWRGGNELSTEQWKKVITELKELGCVEVLVTGGEPFLRKDIVEILQYLDSEEFIIDINTNGSLVTREMVACLKNLKFLRNVSVSLYALTDSTMEKITNSSTKVSEIIDNAKFMSEEGLNIDLKYIPLKDSVDDLKDIQKFAETCEIRPIVAFSPVMPRLDFDRSSCENGLSKEQILGLLKQKLTVVVPNEGLTYCNNYSRCSISPQGNVSTCEWLANQPYGNINETSVTEIWHSDQLEKKFNEFALNTECTDCDLKNYCDRCHAYAYVDSERWDGVSRLCCEFAKYKAEFCGGLANAQE